MTRPHPDTVTSSYRAIVDAIPDMIIRIGRDHVFRSFEGKVNELYRPEVDYLGKRIEDVLPEGHGDSFCRPRWNPPSRPDRCGRSIIR